MGKAIFLYKVKKSLTRWELWFLFAAVVQVEIKLEGWIFLTQLDCPGYADLQLPTNQYSYP